MTTNISNARILSGFRRLATAMSAAIIATAAILGGAGAASASSIVALVNDEPVTDFELQQRMRLNAAISGGRGGGRQAAIEELIDERLMLQSARRLGISISPDDVEQAFGTMAGNMQLSPSQLTQALGQIGVSPEAFKRRLQVQLAWREVVQSQLQRQVQIRQRDIELALNRRGEEASGTSVELAMRQVMFVVPSGSSANYSRQRRQEAETFRRQFTGCEGLMEQARSYRDTVVRPEVRRNLSDLSPELNRLLTDLQPGQMSAVRDAGNAVEVIAVCERREVSDTRAARQQMQTDFVNTEGDRLARRLLMDLRQAASIEHR